MQAKRLFVKITILFSLLFPNFLQARNVSIPDTNLAAAIRQEIGNSITTDALLNLKRLEARNRGIKDLTGLEHAHNLEALNLSGEYIEEKGVVNSNTISDLSPITGLANLKFLELSNCSISDVAPLSKLTQLDYLGLPGNNISDVSALSGLTQLNYLGLWGNDISDVSALSGLIQLNHLDLSGNDISDISPLAKLTQLQFLDIQMNEISDVSPLAGLTQLPFLYLYSNDISDISPLAGLTQLRVLNLNNNAVLDVSPLVALDLPGTEWDSTGLYIENNPLNYASLNTHIPAMQAKALQSVMI